VGGLIGEVCAPKKGAVERNQDVGEGGCVHYTFDMVGCGEEGYRAIMSALVKGVDDCGGIVCARGGGVDGA